jgi:hypothetical protein
MEKYETIGVAVRQHDAIRFSIVKGEPQTYFVSAEWVPLLWAHRTVPIFRLRLAGNYVEPEQVPAGSATISSTGKTVILTVGYDSVLIPTRQLQVHYDRDLGETSKIVRPVEATVSTFATAPTMAVV